MKNSVSWMNGLLQTACPDLEYSVKIYSTEKRLLAKEETFPPACGLLLCMNRRKIHDKRYRQGKGEFSA